ncbi:hypothetical protein [Pleionea litopenaei]|uniref:Uncharacterized protein n=1 Tax=Pleionea litopenaei TaxID=3070815 RepID=A0AA51X7V7_9GAMM|nr:hypothetical protein [Pleionea sp. HL-JVS1]WMS87505.1 hypothetical protein Q9312_00910 [Pleionea sp. HL-JVS1]
MIDLVRKIHDGYGTSSLAGIKFIEQFRGEIKKYNAKELFAFLMENCSCKFTSELLLSSEDLLNNLSSDDWISILECSNRAANPLDENNDGFFTDIYFLVKYLRLDFFDYLLASDKVSSNDKKNILSFCKLKSSRLALDELDIEDMDGDYFISYEVIERKRLELLENDVFNEIKFSDIYEHMDELERKYSFR